MLSSGCTDRFRREMRWLIMRNSFLPVLLTIFSSAPSVNAVCHAGNVPQYNLLIIQTDEHNFRTLGCYRDTLPADQALMWGSAVVETPHIDWIAKHGAICTSFYATTPVCSPSRASLVTGRYPQRTAVVKNDIPLRDDMITFAEVLRRNGYRTGFAGKWHLDGTGKPQWEPERKFGFDDNRYMFNRGHWKQLEDSPEGPRVAARNNLGAPSYAIDGSNETNFTTDFLTQKTVDFISRNRDEPFCYWLSLPDPHGPDTVRAPYDSMFADQSYDRPRSFYKEESSTPRWAEPQAGKASQSQYYGMVKCIDDNVGKILNTLRELEILNKSIVVFTSDHGDLRGEHQRQNKGVPYEGSARIPFLVYFPGQIEPGTVVNAALTCVDFQPTILKMMGSELSGQEDGRDASRLFSTGKTPDDWTDVAFIRGTGDQQGWLTVLTDRYKLVYSSVDHPWLFDMERDPDELNNVFTHAGYRETIQQLSKALRDYGNKYDEPFMNDPRINSDLQWAIEGTGEYKGLPLSDPKAGSVKGKKR